ncbi:MAG: DnaJ domain-containing protein [Spirochaetes bacterium]|nr:DnaJ domain-containing protein [Spirochaetota bacterium]
MREDDYYTLLGIDKTASTKEIKTAFRKLALKHHPDKNPGDPGAERKFKEISAAYEILSDPLKKRSYDFSLNHTGWYNTERFGAQGDTGVSPCGRGGGCCGKRGGFRRMAAAGPACVVELNPEEARTGVEREFLIRGPSGYGTLSVSIPPGAKNGTVLMVASPTEPLHAGVFSIKIKIV